MGSPNAFSTAAPAILAAGMLAALLGCTENTQSPTDAETSSSPPGLATASAALVFREMSAGGLHSCAVTEADRAYCWGAGPYGQLGSGTTPLARLTPIAVIGGLAFRQISAGREFTCGVTTDDRAYCWGFNGNGQLGDGTQTSRLAPVAVKGNHRFRRVSAGYTHACAVTTDQRAFCWGLLGTDLPVALGNGSTVGSTIPVRVAGGLAFRHVSAGVFHSCGVTTADQVFCWGWNTHGQIGDGTATTTDRVRPARVAGTRLFKQVDAGEFHTCAVTRANRAFCWGDNRAGQLGDGTRTGRFSPRAVAGAIAVNRVTTGGQFSCGEAAGNLTYCWGSNASGQLGLGSDAGGSDTPVLVTGGFLFVQVSAGGFHTCARTATGRGYCWGNNGNGSLGNGSTVAFFNAPVPVAGTM